MAESRTSLKPEEDVLSRRELYKFSPEELRVLKECNYESFYFRSLPLGTILGAVAFYGVKSGYFKGSTRWGAWPKIIIGASVGYFAGKLSYQTKCAEKLMTLPNSPLAEALRQRKGKNKGFQEVFTSEPINLGQSSYTSDAEGGNQPDYLQEIRSEDRSYDAPPTAVGLNDSFRPSMDSFVVSEQPLPSPVQSSSSYDDLRRRNREEFEQKRLDAYRKTDGIQTTPNVAPPPSSGYAGPQNLPSGSRTSDKKNLYGDVWEE